MLGGFIKVATNVLVAFVAAFGGALALNQDFGPRSQPVRVLWWPF